MNFKLKTKSSIIVALAGLVIFVSSFLPPISGYAAGGPELLWERRYDAGIKDDFDGDVAHDVATDMDNNLIVTGMSNYDYYTIKYDSNGNQLWNKRYNSGFNDKAFAVAADSKNNIIVTGRGGDPRNGNVNYFTIKYDVNGNQLWTDNFGTGEMDLAYDVAVDSNDNIIITGHFLNYSSTLGYNWDFLTINYDTNGRRLWYKIYNKGNDRAYGVAIDSKDNVVVTGSSNWDFFTIKYDTNGNELWSRTLDNGSTDTGYSVSVDSLDNIIVVGNSYDAVNRTDYTSLIKYDSSGEVLWKKSYNRGSWNGILSVAVDLSDNIIVTGTYHNINYYTIACTPDGDILWEKIYDGGSTDIAHGVAVDSMDNVIVTGRSSNGQNYDYLTFKYGEPVIIAPLASFAASPASGDAPLPVRFTDTSTNSPTSWSWNFGDSSPVSTIQNPTHIYNSAGTYTVSLTVSNSAPAGSDTENKPDYITVTQPNRNPVLDPIGNKQVNENQLLSFTVSATDPDKDALTYSADGLPFGSSFNFSTKAFSWTPDFTQGTRDYSLTFNVYDGQGGFDNETIKITVKDVIIPPTYQCSDNLDNDHDGLVDLNDPGCSSSTDDDETDIPLPVCGNGTCEDGEGNCPQDCPVADNPPTACVVNPGQTVQAGTLVRLNGSCSSDPDNDPLAYQWTQTLGTSVSLNHPNQAIANFTAPDPQLSQGLINSLALSARVVLEFLGLISAQESQETLEFRLTVTAKDQPDSAPAQVIVTPRPTYQCSDNLDNDNDGLIDLSDPGCASTTDDDETDSVSSPLISISNPPDNGLVQPRSTINITTEVSYSEKITRVEFHINGQKKHTDRNYPYSHNWRVPRKHPASYRIQAKLYVKNPLSKGQIMAAESEVITVRAE